MKPGIEKIPEDIVAKQREAADPAHSAWVSANAGSGKTHVLSRRVMRLLLQGTDPSRILCLTYTRAAAAEMSNRVFGDLGKWALLEDDELRAELAALENRKLGAETLAQARRLFARALETPGGLKIQTIHAFCEAVLHRFPLEANIAGRFELADQAAEARLLVEARRQTLQSAQDGSNPGISDALVAVLAVGGESGFEKLLSETIAKRADLAGFLSQFSEGGLRTALLNEFGFSEDDDHQSVAATAWPLSAFDVGYVDALLGHAQSVTAKTAITFAEGFMSVKLSAKTGMQPIQLLELLSNIFLKKDGAARSTSNLCSAKVSPAFPDLEQRFLQAADQVIGARDRLALLCSIEATIAAMELASAVIRRYDQLKTARGLLDFNDLINRTAQLLARPDAGPWIQYKLDKGIDHILVDEAQDTSPQQWAVISQLAQEFFTGESARSDTPRTLFAVGDEKQSIYSFQGADPDIFEETRHEFTRRIKTAGKELHPVKLDYSFRSTVDVLNAVDHVFGHDRARAGLTRDPGEIVHRAIRENQPGFVQLWESIGENAVEEKEDWRQAVDHDKAAPVRLAENVADKIDTWLKTPGLSPVSDAPLSPGDILVLVRKRDRFMHALSRALKERHIPVAGADRLKLRDHIAIKDLLALGRFLLQPDDDLSLAAVLKSPIFGLDDDDLMKIAIERGETVSLAEALNRSANNAGICKRLEGWGALAQRLPVFDFFARVLGRDGVRKDMIARLGNEAADLLDEFLNAALTFEQSGKSGLEAFLAAVDLTGQEVKREAGAGRDEIRIMTTHAAKGLEARLVFLVDSGGAPTHANHRPRLLPIQSASGNWTGTGYLWKGSSELASSVTRRIEAGWDERASDEYRRLLYVAMTRAEDGLVVCGYHGQRGRGGGTWHALVEHGLRPVTETSIDPETGLEILTYRDTPGPRVPKSVAAHSPSADITAPAFLKQKVSAAPVMPRPLAPSGVSVMIEDAPESPLRTGSPVLLSPDGASHAQRRGVAIHRLLQKLPDIAIPERKAVAEKYLRSALPDSSDSERASMLLSAFSVLNEARFAPVFSAGSRAEVAIMGTLRLNGEERAISGKIDRLAVNEREVLIVDYKTNRPPPSDPSSIPGAYVAQMALYRRLITPLYANRTIRSALLFTETPRLFEIEPAAMDQALARLNMS